MAIGKPRKAELIRRYHSRHSVRHSSMSFQDAACEWTSQRAGKFRTYCPRRQLFNKSGIPMLTVRAAA
jgi:hypothetical protein